MDYPRGCGPPRSRLSSHSFEHLRQNPPDRAYADADGPRETLRRHVHVDRRAADARHFLDLPDVESASCRSVIVPQVARDGVRTGPPCLPPCRNLKLARDPLSPMCTSVFDGIRRVIRSSRVRRWRLRHGIRARVYHAGWPRPQAVAVGHFQPGRHSRGVFPAGPARWQRTEAARADFR